jgi:peptidoglycan/xylan/chitin deacetylase (PgdA/CDA1 family)
MRSEGEPSQCLVVMYHYVRDRDVRHPLMGEGVCALTTTEFATQIDELAARFEPITWPALFAHTQGQADLPRQGFLLTFDDALREHAELVAPMLEARGLRGTFFIPGDVLAREQLLPAHMVHVLLSQLGVDDLAEVLDRHLHEIGWCVQEQTGLSEQAIDEAAARMYHYETSTRARLKYLINVLLPIGVRSEALSRLFERYVGAAHRWSRDWYLTWDDLSLMDSRGHTIGGHGMSHEPFARLSSDQRRREARQVAELLAEGLGPDRRPFSFPFGSYDEDASEAVHQAGFVHAFTTEERWLEQGDDPFRLPRVDTIHVEAVIGEEQLCAATR